MSKNYFIRMEDVAPYHPANHHGTSNYRLISEETVGARHVEMLIGIIEKNHRVAACASRHRTDLLPA
jgi:hypothetical protein